MLRRYWIIFAVTVGLALFVGPQGYAQQEAEQPQEYTTIEEQPANQLPTPLPVIIIEEDETASARQGREAISDKNQSDDLVAQQRMAEATEAMNKATQSMKNAAWVSAFLVFVGTGLLIWTLRLTRKATSITQDVGNAQIRPFPLIKSGGKVHIHSSTSGTAFALEISIVNDGKIPMYDVVLTYTAYLSRSRSDQPKSIAKMLGGKKEKLACIASGETVPVGTVIARTMDVVFEKINAGHKFEADGSSCFFAVECSISSKDWLGKTVPVFSAWLYTPNNINLSQGGDENFIANLSPPMTDVIDDSET